jgi:phytoene dehydrogenase-like protein
MQHYDVVVVGSGHNGLIAACYLAKAGLKVMVLEAKQQFGGATQSTRIFPDYEAWLSRYSYLISLLPQKIMDDLEINLSLATRRIGSFTAWEEAGRQNGFLISNENQQATRQAITDLGGDNEWQGYQYFMGLVSEIARIFWPTLLEPLRSRADFEQSLQGDMQREAWQAFVNQPLGEVIERSVSHDALRGLLMTDGKIGVYTRPHDPSLVQNRCFLYHVVGRGNGQWMVPIGGMRTLVDGLLKCARRHEVDLRVNSPVVRIERGSAEHQVYFADEAGEQAVSARHVLVNAAPSKLAAMLGEAANPHPENEGSVAKVNMLLKRLPKLRASQVSSSDAFTGSFHVDEGYDAMIQSYQQTSDGSLPDRPPFEVYCHSLTDTSILSPQLAAEGYHTLTLFGLDIPYRCFSGQGHDAKRQQLLNSYLQAMAHVCAESFVDCLATDSEGSPCVEIKSPWDLEQEVGLDQGNIFHTAPSWFFAESDEEVGSWGVSTGFDRIYAAGSSARRGGAVSGIPGYCSAMQVLADRGSL